MPKFLRKFATGAAVVALGFSLAPAAPASAVAPTDPVWAVTASNKLISFNSGTPGTLTSSAEINGLATGEKVVGADFRPADGALYVVTNASKIYTVALNGGKVTYKSTISPLLVGTQFGVDFNNAADRLRITSNEEQNLRVNVDTGIAINDGAVNYVGGTPTPAQTSETAVAYTNPSFGAPLTTMYGIDTGSDRLVVQSPPNDGTLANAPGSAALGINVGEVGDMDLTSDGSLVAALALDGAATSGYYSIGTSGAFNGVATLVGTVGVSELVTDIAVPLPSQSRTYGVTTDNRVVTMEGTGVGHVAKNVPITGLQASETVVGIDVRPATGQLFAVGSSSRIYKLDPASGVATAVGSGPFTPALSGASFDVDFNPTVDRIRVVSDTGQNLRLNPINGTVAATDTNLAFAGTDTNAGDTPAVSAAGYTNSVFGATSTVLYGIDAGNDVLVRQDPPNAGTLNTVGTGIGFLADASTAFDISSDGKAMAAVSAGAVTSLYSVDLTTGSSTGLGIVPLPVALTDIAVADSQGYAFVASDGGVFNFGGSRFEGSTGSLTLNQPIVGMANRAPGQGYWLVARDGGVFSFGDATFHGSLGDKVLNQPIVGAVATPSGLGYWLVARDGGVFSFGDAKFWGSKGGERLNAPIVGMSATKSGNGYWLFAADGGVFTFGDATFYGSTGDLKLNRPIVGGAVAANGYGYYLVASDGGIFNFGIGAPFYGSAGATRLNQPIVGMTVDPTGKGYWLTASDGGVFSYGSPFLGSMGNKPLNQPIVGVAAS